MILANDFSSGLIRFQKLLAQMANRVLLDLARADHIVTALSTATVRTIWLTKSNLHCIAGDN